MGQPVTRWQIVSPRADELAKFYCNLFDWEASRNNLLNYQAIDTGSETGIPGGIWPAPPEATSFVQLFIEVDNCAACASEAVDLGGSVLMPAQALPDGDVMAILRDPGGMTFGIVEKAKA